MAKVIQGINNHQKLVRAAVIAIEAMKNSCESYSEHAGARIDKLLPAMEDLSAALHGQHVRDEEVTIEVRGGVAEVTSKTEFVKVTIIKHNNT